jgi:hypothetical protein
VPGAKHRFFVGVGEPGAKHQSLAGRGFYGWAGHSDSAPILVNRPAVIPNAVRDLHFCLSAFLPFGFPRFEEEGLDF